METNRGGRPKLEKTKKPISIRLSQESLRKLDAICANWKTNRTMFLELMIDEEYKKLSEGGEK